jgi:hypothetical protein
MLLYARSLKNVCSTLGGRYRSTPRGEFAPNTLSIYAFNGSGGPEAVTPCTLASRECLLASYPNTNSWTGWIRVQVIRHKSRMGNVAHKSQCPHSPDYISGSINTCDEIVMTTREIRLGSEEVISGDQR